MIGYLKARRCNGQYIMIMKDYTSLLDECIIDNITNQTLRHLIRKTIESIGRDILYLGEEVSLSWEHLESYLATRIPAGVELFDNVHTHILSVLNEVIKTKDLANNNHIRLIFDSPQTAIAFFNFTIHIFPLKNTEYPKIDSKNVYLADEQYLFCLRAGIDKTKELPIDYLDDSLLKTLRADQFDFSNRFILGIIPGENGSRRLQNLRPSPRKHFIITSQGKIAIRTNKRPTHTAEQKKGFSQIQSCTLIDQHCLSQSFGFSKERTHKLYGLMTHRNDALINRMLINDSGTVNRVFDHNNEEDAKKSQFFRGENSTPSLYHPHEIEVFKERNIATRMTNDKTNEVMARLRFNPYRSLVCICSDTLEARLLANDFAEELLAHYSAYAIKNATPLNPHFKIPTIFYLKKPHPEAHESKHQLLFYTSTMHLKDKEEALNILRDENLRLKHYSDQNYEFLLGLDHLTAEILLEPIAQVPLAIAMMRNGYTRMLMRLLRDKSNLRDELFDTLLRQGAIKDNDPLIGHLIIAEAFELATKIINFNNIPLVLEEEPFATQLLAQGNPRQLNYLGLDRFLMAAALMKSWVTIRLCLKEYTQIDKTTLCKLLSEACRTPPYFEVASLLRMGIGDAETVRLEIKRAIKKNDWLLVQTLIFHYKGPRDPLDLGTILLEAIRKKQQSTAEMILLLWEKPCWVDVFGLEHKLMSLSLYAIEGGFNEILPTLLRFEALHRRDEYSVTRYKLAFDLALVQSNQKAVELLSQSTDWVTMIDYTIFKKNICRLVFEAFFANQSQIAQYRLLRYTRLYDLIPIGCNNLVESIRIIAEHYLDTIIYFHNLPNVTLLNGLAQMLLIYRDIKLLKSLFSTTVKTRNIDSAQAEEVIAKYLLRRISLKNIYFIIEVINNSDNKQSWSNRITRAFKKAIEVNSHSDNPALLYEISALIIVEMKINTDNLLNSSPLAH
jgi:hypothetical protein